MEAQKSLNIDMRKKNNNSHEGLQKMKP